MLPGGWSAATLPTSALNPAVGGLLVAKRAEHPGFHVIGVMAVKCPLTGVVSDQVGDHGFTVAEKDGVLA